MNIEVVGWKTAKKTHVLAPEDPSWTLCGQFVPEKRAVKKIEGHDAWPTCFRCAKATILA